MEESYTQGGPNLHPPALDGSSLALIVTAFGSLRDLSGNRVFIREQNALPSQPLRPRT